MTKQWVLTVHSLFSEPLAVIGPFANKAEAMEWRLEYTEHRMNIVKAVELLNPKENQGATND